MSIALVLGALAGVAASCGGGQEQSSAPATTAATAPGGAERGQAPSGSHQTHHRHVTHEHRQGGHNAPRRRESTRAAVRAAVQESKPARLNADQRAAARVVRDYASALNSRDGERVCRLFVSGALDEVRLPRDRGGCAPSLSASIGYRDPRGFPVYERSRVARIRSVTIDGASARAVATIVTRFAGNREPSIEDDIVYLQQQDGHWLIAKPSATLYRAIGTGDIPPSVLAPP